jgi:flagellar biosynthesis regulator FlaF
MVQPNTNFNLNVKDLETIETALRLLQTNANDTAKSREIIDLLARLYHQKVWYRPASDTYVGG